MRIFILVIGAVGAACMAPGERAATCQGYDCSGGTTCPPGETCSNLTPDGLHFGGSQTGDNQWGGGPMTTATGGRQTIRIDGLNGLAFDAQIQGDGLAVVSTGYDTVLVEGRDPSGGVLRIVDPATGALFDRIGLDVDDLASAAIRTREPWYPSGSDYVLWSGTDQRAEVALVGTTGARLADEGLTLAPEGTATLAAGTWDSFVAHVPIASPLTITGTLTDGTPIAAAIDVAGAVDEIAPASGPGAPPPPWTGVKLGGWSGFQFRIDAGGREVVAVPIETAVDAPISLYPAIGNEIPVEGDHVGTGHLTVTAGATTRTFDVPVYATLRAEKSAPPPAPAPQLAPGERAASSAR